MISSKLSGGAEWLGGACRRRRRVILMKAAKVEGGGNFNESGKSEMPYNRTKYLRLDHVIGVL